MIKNIFFLIIILFGSASCFVNQKSDIPSWFINSKQNDKINLYGIGSGFSLEDATKLALADMASRLFVTISSESTSLKEENRFDFNEENRQKIKQTIEKIDFTGFKVSKSEKIGANFFVELQIEKFSFVKNQKEKIAFLEKRISDLKKNIYNLNLVQKRGNLQKMLEFSKELEISSRILDSLGINISSNEKLKNLADIENQLNSINNKIEFYFDIDSPKEISNIIKNALNKEKIIISNSRNYNPNQVVIKIMNTKSSSKIYGAFITKLSLEIENIVNQKIIASNSIEITGSSTISANESYKSSIKSLEEKIINDGILKIIGIAP